MIRAHSGPPRAAAHLAARLGKAGQVTVELLLVLPVFMLLLFFIMEIGNLGFNTILAHHCAYELARVGSLVAGTDGSGSGGGESLANQKMTAIKDQMFPSTPGITVVGKLVQNPIPSDPQSGQQSMDFLVTLTYKARLIFPGSSAVFSDPPKGSRTKIIIVKVRMPVEQPYLQ